MDPALCRGSHETEVTSRALLQLLKVTQKTRPGCAAHLPQGLRQQKRTPTVPTLLGPGRVTRTIADTACAWKAGPVTDKHLSLIY